MPPVFSDRGYFRRGKAGPGAGKSEKDLIETLTNYIHPQRYVGTSAERDLSSGHIHICNSLEPSGQPTWRRRRRRHDVERLFLPTFLSPRHRKKEPRPRASRWQKIHRDVLTGFFVLKRFWFMDYTLPPYFTISHTRYLNLTKPALYLSAIINTTTLLQLNWFKSCHC